MDPNPATNEPVYERLAYEAALRRSISRRGSSTNCGVGRACCSQRHRLRLRFLGERRSPDTLSVGSPLSRWSLSCLRLGQACTCSCLRPASSSLRWSAPDCTRGFTNLGTTLGEVYRRLAYDLDRFWDDNDVELQKLFRAFRLAALGLSAEIVILIAMVSDSLL